MSKLKQKISTLNKVNNRSQPLVGVITDTHLDRRNYELVIDIFTQFVTFCRESEVKIAVHMGDWFTDRAAQNVGRLSIIRYIIDMFAENNIVLHTIPGNHDKQDLTAALSYLTPYSSKHDQYFHLHSTNYLTLAAGSNIYMHFAPYWLEDDGLYLEMLTSVNVKALAGLKQQGFKNVLFTHIAVNGVRNNDGTIVADGIEVEAFSQFDKVFVGHYHNQCKIEPNIYYTGSAYQANYGEDEAKGFTLLYDDCTFEFYQSQFKPYRHYHIKATDATELRKLLLAISAPGLAEQQHTRVTFEGSQHELQAIDRHSLAKWGVEVRFKNTVELNVDEEAIEKAEHTVMTSGIIKQHFLHYMVDRKYSKDQRHTAMKYLKYLT